MEKGDVVKHKFSGARYLVEKVTLKKAKVRQLLAHGRLSDGTTMVLRRNLTVVKDTAGRQTKSHERRW